MTSSAIDTIQVFPKPGKDNKILQDSISLPSHDLWMTFIKRLHVIPVELDVQHFSDALSSCLWLYRPVCGRLRQNSTRWKIDLEDCPIPVEILKAEDKPGSSLSSWVVQDSSFIAPYLSSTPALRDDSLLRIRMTIGRGQTVLGVSWHHVLGDATTLLRFLRSLSQLYQNLPLLDPLPDFSSSSKHFFNPSANVEFQQLIAKHTPSMPHLACTYPSFEIGLRYAERNQGMVPVMFRLRRRRVEELLDWLRTRSLELEGSDVEGNLKLTRQDCITACVAVILSLCRRNCVKKITNAAVYRGVKAQWTNPASAGNPIYVVPTEEIDDSHATDIRYIAERIRQSLTNARQPDFVESYMSVAGHYMDLAAANNTQFFFGSEAGVLSVNSQLSLDWHSIHFGYPGLVKFYTSGMNKFYLRVFCANPGDLGEDSDTNGAVDISFGVSEEMRDPVLKMLGDVEDGRFDFLYHT